MCTLHRSGCRLGEIKIADFGAATRLSEDSAGRAQCTYQVTRPYRAPELCLDNELYNERVDIWSFGCIFAEVRCGA